VRRLSLLLAAILAVGACGGSRTQSSILQPDVVLKKVAVRSLGLLGGNLDVVLSVTNPNPFLIQGTRLDLGLDLQGTHFGDVVLNDAFNLPQDQPTRVVVPLSFKWTGVGQAARGILDYGELNYVMQGRGYYQTPVGEVRIPFTRQGSVTVTSLGR